MADGLDDEAVAAAAAAAARKGEIPSVRIRAMTVPVGFEDLTRALDAFTYEAFSAAVASGRGEALLVRAVAMVGLMRDPTDESPRLVGELVDAHGRRVRFWCPDAAQPLVRYNTTRRGRPVLLLCQVRLADGDYYVSHPVPVSGKWLGRVRPVYNLPPKTFEAQIERVDDLDHDSYLAEARVQNVMRENVLLRLKGNARRVVEAIVTKGLKTQGALRAALGEAHAEKADHRIATLFRDMHLPTSMAHANETAAAIDHVAACCMLVDSIERAARARRGLLMRKRKPRGLAPEAAQMGYPAYARMVAQVLPFQLTEEQLETVASLLAALDSGLPMRAMLIGDVGSGKTAVFGMAVRAMLLAGCRVAVMLPGVTLARQVHRNIAAWVPEFRSAFVAGDCERPGNDVALCVGTTKMLTATAGAFDFVVVDEQQKLARSQREEALADCGHLLEVTATCIPRSQALVETGQVTVFRLLQCHVNKDIETRLRGQGDWNEIVRRVRETLRTGGQVAVIFPAIHACSVRVGSDSDSDDEIKLSALMEHVDWWEKHFHGLVRVCHGGRTDEENDRTLVDMVEGHGKIMLSTTMVEVGVDIGGLRHIIVMQPDRFGLSPLHQLRGRVARRGGKGYCDLYASTTLGPAASARLKHFCETFDGFALASFDLANRGGGDITDAGHKQVGTMPKNPFPDRVITVAQLDRASAALSEQYFERECASAYRIAGTTRLAGWKPQD